MINNVVLVGRLVAEPELRKTQNGTSVCVFTLAVNREFSKDGQQEADFIQCVAWNKTADYLTQYLHKGYLVDLHGRIQTRNYDNSYGQKVYVTEVNVEKLHSLEPKKQQQMQTPEDMQNNQMNTDFNGWGY